jgi:hypothetical protein
MGSLTSTRQSVQSSRSQAVQRLLIGGIIKLQAPFTFTTIRASKIAAITLAKRMSQST